MVLSGRTCPKPTATQMADSQENLQSYRYKRDFHKTDEPDGEGTPAKSEKSRFVIHLHDASSLHFDLRLEAEGVLKSWAVPKGPSTDPSDKRLALPTEDHPLNYADFEGVIPEGQYGAGAVLVWDRGSYRNLTHRDDPESGSRSGTESSRHEIQSRLLPITEAIEQGQVKFWLDGEKLRGGYALTRIEKGDPDKWLLVKMDDDQADARRNPTSTENRSVISHRTLEEIARDA